ncbi:MAG: hypothetical protein Q8R92_03505 [Deltaproteobacteria bacterium]|nr:hypothetical protein [Deltaproteobacteria bacterium]
MAHGMISTLVKVLDDVTGIENTTFISIPSAHLRACSLGFYGRLVVEFSSVTTAGVIIQVTKGASSRILSRTEPTAAIFGRVNIPIDPAATSYELISTADGNIASVIVTEIAGDSGQFGLS